MVVGALKVITQGKERDKISTNLWLIKHNMKNGNIHIHIELSYFHHIP